MEGSASPEVSLDLQPHVLPLSYDGLKSFHLPRLRGGSFCLPFEVFLALGAINGNGKAKKSYAFTTPNLKYCSPSRKKRKKRRRRRRWR